jgi:hypothetical protein
MPPASALDHAGAQHQLVADDLGVGGRFFERGQKNCEVRMG